jgi:hypothetical protein
MTYKIIQDEVELNKFIGVLPDLEPDEKYYFSLFARKKYDDSVQSSDRADLARFLCYKDQIYDKIKQLEAPFGSYKSKGYELPNRALALYCHPNPRNLRKATWSIIRELTKRLETGQRSFNPHNDAMTACHKTKSRSYFVDFDIDLDDKVVIQSLKWDIEAIVGKGAYTLIETRGGMHCLVRPELVSGSKMWYQMIKNQTDGCDQTGDLLIPVPGCTQGNFCPRILS